MASLVDLCNVALSHIGADATVSSIAPPDGSAEAGYCARFAPLVRRELLEYQNWAFSKTRVQLAAVDNPSTIWQYAYAVPSGMINALRVLRLEWFTDLALYVPIGSYMNYFVDWNIIDDMLTERDSADFEIETTAAGSQILLTNEPNAVLIYTGDAVDTTKWSPLFSSAFGMVLAGYLAGPIIKGMDGANIGAQWRKAGFAMADTAAASNANSANERAQHVAEHIRARS